MKHSPRRSDLNSSFPPTAWSTSAFMSPAMTDLARCPYLTALSATSPWSHVGAAPDLAPLQLDRILSKDEEGSGTVVRAGTYTLYCDHSDHFIVIDPVDHPGWEVKIFHFEGLQVAVGDLLEAGVTLLGTSARVLPFESQVDEFTAEPSNPHVHIEVVDPSIPDRPGTTGGC